MAKYVVKQTEIDAFQYDGDFMNSDGEYYVPDWAVEAHKAGILYFKDDGKLFVKNTNSDDVYSVSVGDYVLRFDDGEIYAISAESFHENYDLKTD